MEYNADHVEGLGDNEEILGKLFLLKSFQYLPGFKDKFKDKLDVLKAFVEKNLKNDEAKMLPFMVLDSFIENELKYEELIIKIFTEIDNNLEKYKYDVGKLSYALYLSYNYIKSGQNHDIVLSVNNKSAEMLFGALEANKDYSSIFNDSCYCLFNLGRIDSLFLKKHKLENYFYFIREWGKKYLANNTSEISYNKNKFSIYFSDEKFKKTLPPELANAKDKYVNIYMLCILLRALAESSPDPKHLKIAVAHNQLKILYEQFFDPVYKKFKVARVVIVILLITILLFAFDFISFSHVNFVIQVKSIMASILSSDVIDKLYHHAGGITAIITAIVMLVAFFKFFLPFARKKSKR